MFSTYILCDDNLIRRDISGRRLWIFRAQMGLRLGRRYEEFSLIVLVNVDLLFNASATAPSALNANVNTSPSYLLSINFVSSLAVPMKGSPLK
mmetsp:Transcript_29868/g.49014  ORF Transcript_29868/g.49014 Transcript_29868/m.49014 type:complete len:93 (-) Transcript_29868:1277-1555(-)